MEGWLNSYHVKAEVITAKGGNILFGDGRDVLTIQQDMPGAYCINSGDAVEPGALDSNSSRVLLEVMSNFNREMGATILMVTHNHGERRQYPFR